MFDFFEKLRHRNEKYRRIVVFCVSFGLTLAIFVIWLSVFSATEIYGDKPQVTYEEKSPLTTFKESFANSFSGMKDQLKESGKAIKNSIENIGTVKTENQNNRENIIENPKTTEENDQFNAVIY